MLSNIYLSARKAVVTNQKKEDLGVNGHKDEGRSIDVDKNRTFRWKNNVLSRPVGIKGTRKQERRNHGPPRRILRSPRTRGTGPGRRGGTKRWNMISRIP